MRRSISCRGTVGGIRETIRPVILTNGRIYTLDPVAPRIAGLPVTRDGRVARGVEAWEGDASQVSNERIDLDGRTVLPGLVDAHVHFRTWAIERSRVDLTGSRSVREIAERAAAPPGDWVIGQGWRAVDAGGEPGAALLDEVCGDRPVALWAHDRHTLVLSTRAMELTGTVTPGGLLREHDAWNVPLPEPSAAAAARSRRRRRRRPPTPPASRRCTTSSATAGSRSGSSCTPTAR